MDSTSKRVRTHPDRVPLSNKELLASNNDETRNFGSGLALLVIFALSISALGIVFYMFPHLEQEDMAKLKLPRSIEDAKDLGILLSKYKETHYVAVVGAVVLTYILLHSLQTFAIPGSIFLSILSGFLFPFMQALFMVCMCSALGASFCYLLSSMVGHQIVKRYIPDRIQSWKSQVARHHQDMVWYIMFLRITPFLPNWFINLASPIVGVKIQPFFLGTFFGVAPPSFFFIRAGTTLYELTMSTGGLSLQSVLVTGLLAVLSLVPVALRRTFQKKLE